MSGIDIEQELRDQGYDVDGIVVMRNRGVAYAVGFMSDELPDSVQGFEIIDDPQLSELS